MLEKIEELSAIGQFVRGFKFDRVSICLACIDAFIGVTIWNAIYDLDLLLLLDHLSKLISHIDEIISWLTSNPVGLKLNEPVNFALASFFRYHLYLWHTFVWFLYAPWLISIVESSFCIGFTCGLALCTDALSLFTLHIHCFDVYASRTIRKRL